MTLPWRTRPSRRRVPPGANCGELRSHGHETEVYCVLERTEEYVEEYVDGGYALEWTEEYVDEGYDGCVLIT